MTLHTVQLVLFAVFASLGVASWFLVTRVATLLEAAKGPPQVVESLHALAFSGEGGPSIWPGHKFILHREYRNFGSVQLKAAGNRAFALLCLVYIDATAIVVAMLAGSL
jgi:hypothetical protein